MVYVSIDFLMKYLSKENGNNQVFPFGSKQISEE